MSNLERASECLQFGSGFPSYIGISCSFGQQKRRAPEFKLVQFASWILARSRVRALALRPLLFIRRILFIVLLRKLTSASCSARSFARLALAQESRGGRGDSERESRRAIIFIAVATATLSPLSNQCNPLIPTFDATSGSLFFIIFNRMEPSARRSAPIDVIRAPVPPSNEAGRLRARDQADCARVDGGEQLAFSLCCRAADARAPASKAAH